MLNSNSNRAKNIIRQEIRNYYGDKNYTSIQGGYTSVKGMLADSKHFEDYPENRRYGISTYRKGVELVNNGCFACYYNQQAEMLEKIYGKQKVKQWLEKNPHKIHEVYAHLIGREFAEMVSSGNEGFKRVKPLPRKTKDVYEIQQNYGYGWECVCDENDYSSAKRTYKDYIKNTSYPTKIVKKRIKI